MMQMGRHKTLKIDSNQILQKSKIDIDLHGNLQRIHITMVLLHLVKHNISNTK